MRLAQDGVPYTGQGVLSGFFVNTPAICASFYNLRTWRMKIFLFVLAATIFEAAGDAIVRIALRHQSGLARIGLFLLGYTLLALYGTSLNLAPVEFAAVTGIYVATLFVVFQITNFTFFGALPTPPVLVGGAFIVIGGLTVALWR
jgi:small multidrug resistance family-3 protein